MSKVPEGDWIVGVDIGGTNLNVGVVSFEGGLPLAVRSERTEVVRGAKFIVDRVVRMIKESMSEVMDEKGVGLEAFAGVGIGSPGPLDRKTGTVINTPNLGWRNFPLRDLVQNAIGLPATLDNDANAATYGEWWMGAGRGVDTLVGVTLGTGIGGGIVLNGELYHGANDAAAEIGHMTIDSTGRKCNCGNYGCLEAYASGQAIAARAIEGLDSGIGSILPELAGDVQNISAETVFEAVVQGDPYATEVMHDTAKFLGVGLANVINILNPEVLVISGGVQRAGDHLFVPLRAEIRRRAFQVAEQACRIVPSGLKGMAGIIGAVACFKREQCGEV